MMMMFIKLFSPNSMGTTSTTTTTRKLSIAGDKRKRIVWYFLYSRSLRDKIRGRNLSFSNDTHTTNPSWLSKRFLVNHASRCRIDYRCGKSRRLVWKSRIVSRAMLLIASSCSLPIINYTELAEYLSTSVKTNLIYRRQIDTNYHALI